MQDMPAPGFIGVGLLGRGTGRCIAMAELMARRNGLPAAAEVRGEE